MRCSKAQEFISLDLDGQLPPEQAPGLTRHLDDCGGCRDYRADLVRGQRLLAASEPQLPENFEWRLQLKLNQTLTQAAARAGHPWHEREEERGAWWRNFGAAAAVGMAAVLALAMVVGPRSPQPVPVAGQQIVLPAGSQAAGGDRLELDPRASGGPGLGFGTTGQRQVSSGQPAALAGERPAWLDRGWTYRSLEDLRDISRVQAENRQLRSQLFQMQRQLQGRQTQLDTTAIPALDLGEGR